MRGVQQPVILGLILAVCQASAGTFTGSASLGNTAGKTTVWLSSTATTAAAGANIVLSSRTTTTGKTFYLQHLEVAAFLTAPSTSVVANFGSVTVESPTLTVLSSMTFQNSASSPYGYWSMDFPEPVPFQSQATLSIKPKTTTATSIVWLSNLVGYER